MSMGTRRESEGTLLARDHRMASSGAPEHLVQFYETDEFLCELVADYAASGLAAGHAVVLVVTAAHAAAVQERLVEGGLDGNRARAEGRLIVLDAHQLLTAISVDGVPNAQRFEASVLTQLDLAASSHVFAFGEMVDVLWQRGDNQAALQLEDLWNRAQRSRSFTLLCAYHLGAFRHHLEKIHDVCGTHTHVLPPEDGAPQPLPWHLPSIRMPSQHAAELTHRRLIEQALRDSLQELVQRENELRQSQTALEDLVENAPVPMHWVGPDGIIQWANRAELDLLGYPSEHYVGRHIGEFHADAEVIADILARLEKGETITGYEARLRAHDGSIKDVVIHSNVYRVEGEFRHTRCFTFDMTAKRRAELALRESRQRLQTVADALPALVAYVDAEERYRFANLAYQRWFGQPDSSLYGKLLREVLGEEAYAGVSRHVKAALAGERTSFELSARRPQGGECYLQGSYIPHHDPSGVVHGFTAVVSDVSERKRYENAREALARHHERLSKITAAVADAVTDDEVFAAVVDQVGAALGASSAGLWLVDGERRTMSLARSFGYSDSAKAAFAAQPLDAPIRFPALDCVCRGEPLWIGSQAELLESYPHLASTVTRGRTYRIACMPLGTPGNVTGAIGFTFDEPAEVEGFDASFLPLVARYASQALERLRLLASERTNRALAEQSAARMELLSRASRAFAEADRDPSALLQTIVEQVAPGFADAAGIVLRGQGEALELAALYHPDDGALAAMRSLLAAHPASTGMGITGRVVATGESALLAEVDFDSLLAVVPSSYHGWLREHVPRSLAVVPLRNGRNVLGALSASRHRESSPFAPEDVQVLEELGERAALALESSRLQRDNERARLRAELLFELAARVMNAARVEEVFEAALDALGRALDTNRTSILVFDSDGLLRFMAWRGLSAEYRAGVEGHSPWARDERAPEPIVIADALDDPRAAPFRALLREEGIGALAFIPLATSDQLVGKMMVYHREPRELSSHELDMARAIANHVAAAINRFAALEELQQSVRFNEMFTGILGHDLRNPLGAIVTSAHLAIRRGDSARLIKPLARILSSGERMARMIDQMLDFTRVRVGAGLPVAPRSLDLVPLLEQVIDELDDAHPGCSIRLDQRGTTEGSWDGDRLGQVFSNLVANAVEHGVQEAGVDIRIDGDEPARVVVTIHNQGAVPEGIMPRLFEPLSGGARRRHKSQGLGLGLYISREILRAHGGHIEVQSSAAAGTTFRVVLPRASESEK